jgi:hypothetical protein
MRLFLSPNVLFSQELNMGRGILLLVQWVIEFTPIVANLVLQRREKSNARQELQQLGNLSDFIQHVNGFPQLMDSASTFEQEKQLQQQFAIYCRETQLKLAASQRETALQLPEVHKILENWSLRLYPSQILKSHSSQQPLPLRIFLAPPQVQHDRYDISFDNHLDIELRLAEGLREFLSQHYSLHSSTRPTEFLAGAWDSKRFHSEASIKALFGMLKSEPTLILETEVDGEDLNFRVAYWGLGQENYYYKTIARLPFRQMLRESAKARALAWKAVRDSLIATDEPLGDVNRLGGDNVPNLELLEKETRWKAQGIDLSQLSIDYQINQEDVNCLCKILIDCHCLVAGWIADIYHLIYQDVSPLLPELLPNMVKDTMDLQLIEAIVSSYREVYQALIDERRYWAPELFLQLAQSLMYLPEKTWAREQIDHSLRSWLSLHQVEHSQPDIELNQLKSVVTLKDRDYIEQLKSCFAELGEQHKVAQTTEVLAMLTPPAISVEQSSQRIHTISLVRTLAGYSGKRSSIAIGAELRSASIVSSCQVLVSGCLDKTLKVWNLQTGELLRTLKGHSAAISSVAMSSDGQFLASSSLHCPKSNVKVWNLQTGKLLHSSFGQKKSVQAVAIANNGRIVIGSHNKVKIWNLHTGDRLHTLSHSCSIQIVALSLDGQLLAVGRNDGKIKLWNSQTGVSIRTLNGHTAVVNSILFSSDAQRLISASADRTIKIWDVQTGKALQTLSDHTQGVNAIALIPESQILISGSADQTIKLWHLESGVVLQTLTGHTGNITSIAVSSDRQLLVSGSADQTIKIWRLL